MSGNIHYKVSGGAKTPSYFQGQDDAFKSFVIRLIEMICADPFSDETRDAVAEFVFIHTGGDVDDGVQCGSVSISPEEQGATT